MSYRRSILFLLLCVSVGIVFVAYVVACGDPNLGDTSRLLVQAVLFLNGAISAIVSIIACRYWILKISPEINFIAYDAFDSQVNAEKWYNAHVNFFDLSYGHFLMVLLLQL